MFSFPHNRGVFYAPSTAHLQSPITQSTRDMNKKRSKLYYLIKLFKRTRQKKKMHHDNKNYSEMDAKYWPDGLTCTLE